MDQTKTKSKTLRRRAPSPGRPWCWRSPVPGAERPDGPDPLDHRTASWSPGPAGTSEKQLQRPDPWTTGSSTPTCTHTDTHRHTQTHTMTLSLLLITTHTPHILRPLTSAVGAHSPVLEAAAWPSVWRHRCPPGGCGGVRRAPRRLWSTPWEEAAAGRAWAGTQQGTGHPLFYSSSLFVSISKFSIVQRINGCACKIIDFLWYTHTHTHLPLSGQRRARRLQAGTLQWFHLRAGQEVVERSEGIRGPGHWRLIGWTGRAPAGAGAAQTLHVVHRSRHQVTCRRAEGQKTSWRVHVKPEVKLIVWSCDSLFLYYIWTQDSCVLSLIFICCWFIDQISFKPNIKSNNVKSAKTIWRERTLQ